ncbi:MAG: DNA helicase RecG [Chloroflexi bacterium HGW-Chloroflexi-3]|nr:MAG: DNA helicase RecG [Chloroflexi bacterium HGW-Chloroflexi-3]
MFASIEKITKFLLLEIDRQYDNRSVFGGLEKICTGWKTEALIQGVPTDLINEICKILANYHFLDQSSRKESIKKIFEILYLSGNLIKNSNLKYSEFFDTKIDLFEEKFHKEPEPKNEFSNQNLFDLEKVLSNPVIKISGIGKFRADALSRLGILTIKDLIYFFPRKHEDFSNLSTINKLNYSEKVSIAAVVKSIHTRNSKGGKQKITEVIVEDETGNLRITFFNQPFLEKSIKIGIRIMVSGKVDMYMGRYMLTNPEWVELERGGVTLNRIFPYYSLTKNVTQKWLRETISNQISLWVPKISDFFSSEFLSKANILDLPTALKNIHFPENFELKRLSEERFSFQDTFFLHLVMLQQKKNWQKDAAKIIFLDNKLLGQLIDHLPFSLTNAQKKCISEIRNDMASGVPMSRLVQGDVGSGKTIVAAIIIAGTIKNGFQSAVMAPTGILAEQLYSNIRSFLLTNNIISQDEICYISGDTSEKEKNIIKENLKSGLIKVAVGTHALIEEPVEFKNLEFVVIDEQHRFGVMQRKKIRSKGTSSHLLVMTATPIPRTLALTIFGDLDLSIIDEIPPGRKEIKTLIINPQKRSDAFMLIQKLVQEGSQAFIVYPLVESDEEEMIGTNAAVNEYDRLKKEVFPDLTIGLLHGRMKSEEKEKVMMNFRKGIYQILVTTTVIEVGVDVPNAAIMMIEGANRFGLSQLHQLRGRVGRGDKQSYCLLVPETEDAIENERLKAMAATTDGFKLAEIDLSQRGPGDFIGLRQSGYKEIRFSNIMNVKLIERARSLAKEVLENDPDFINENSHLFKIIMSEYWQKMIGEKK